MAWDWFPTPPLAAALGYVHVGKDFISREASDDFLGLTAKNAHRVDGYIQGAMNTKTFVSKNKTNQF